MREGDHITVQSRRYERAAWSHANPFIWVDEGTGLRVTRVNYLTITARGPILPGAGFASVRIARNHVLTVNGVRNPQAGPRIRPIGEKPADTEDMTYIGLDHPGIQWVWEDMARYASEQGWCSQYDDLASEFGIPGRMEEFSIELERNGIPFSVTIKGRDWDHAKERAEALLIS